MIESRNPANEELIGSYSETTDEELGRIADLVQGAFEQWSRVTTAERSEALQRVAQTLERETESLAQLATAEVGKPLSQSRAEVEKCAWVCRYYADEGPKFLEAEAVKTDAAESYVSFQPLGVVLAIMPWNFPFWQLFRFAAPALMAGNAIILKHASNVSGCSLAIEKVFRRAGLPEHFLRSVLISGSDTDKLIENPIIKAATLTGSEAAGSKVASEAGQRIKKTVLELGGSDAYLVLEDADLDQAVPACVAGRLTNSGQSCIAAKRFVVVDSIREAFEAKFVAAMRGKTLGDPLDDTTDIGPLARQDLRRDLHQQVERSVEAGARLALGGELPNGKGYYYPATVLCDVEPGMPAYEEELFGPVASIIAARDEADAIRIANDSIFGLGGGVFTRDIERGKRIAERELQAGACFVNACVQSDPRLPFGGIKSSGYGRELSRYGMHEFVNIKTVYIA